MDIRRDEKQLDLGPVRLKVPESWKKDLVITGKSAFTRVATGWSSVSEASDELGHTTREEFPGADWWEETGFDGVTKSFFQYVLGVGPAGRHRLDGPEIYRNGHPSLSFSLQSIQYHCQFLRHFEHSGQQDGRHSFHLDHGRFDGFFFFHLATQPAAADGNGRE